MKNILITIISVFIVSLALLAICFWPGDDDDKWLKIIQVSITASGFAGALHSLNIAINRTKRNKKLEGVSLFDKFIDEPMRQLRQDAWQVKIRWENDSGYKEKILKLFSSEEKINDEQVKEELREFYKVIKMMSFYDMLSLHEQHKKTIIHLKYFYFDWWRKFLFEVAYELDNRRISKGSLPKGYLENTKYTTSLERLDKMLGFDSFPRDKEMVIHQDLDLNGDND